MPDWDANKAWFDPDWQRSWEQLYGAASAWEVAALMVIRLVMFMVMLCLVSLVAGGLVWRITGL
jgi:hypothetical protein